MNCLRANNIEFFERIIVDARTSVAPKSEMEHVNECPDCLSSWQAVQAVISSMAWIAPAINPPTRVKSRIMGAISAKQSTEQPWKTWQSDNLDEELDVTTEQERQWNTTAFQGVEVCQLAADPDLDRITMLVRMAAGSAYPPHTHGGFEECYVVFGDLKVGNRTLKQGDFQRAPERSIHTTQSTEGGCLLLISSSYHDELFTSA